MTTVEFNREIGPRVICHFGVGFSRYTLNDTLPNLILHMLDAEIERGKSNFTSNFRSNETSSFHHHRNTSTKLGKDEDYIFLLLSIIL